LVLAAAVWAAWVRAERSHSEPLVVEHVVERLPIHARCFHSDQGDLEGGQPVPKLQQPLGGGFELADLLVGFLVLVLSGIDSHACGDGGFVHVESGAPLDDPFQAPLLPSLGIRFPLLFSARRYREEPLVVLKNLVFVL
jgi:hypothetical protein